MTGAANPFGDGRAAERIAALLLDRGPLGFDVLISDTEGPVNEMRQFDFSGGSEGASTCGPCSSGPLIGRVRSTRSAR